jgi:hypothetical protein
MVTNTKYSYETIVKIRNFYSECQWESVEKEMRAFAIALASASEALAKDGSHCHSRSFSALLRHRLR